MTDVQIVALVAKIDMNPVFGGDKLSLVGFGNFHITLQEFEIITSKLLIYEGGVSVYNLRLSTSVKYLKSFCTLVLGDGFYRLHTKSK